MAVVDSVGTSRRTGKRITGWEHVVQSISVIITTPIGTRVMRREFGSEVPLLIDRPMTPRVVLAVYAAAANALRRWEPRFRLTRCEVVKAAVDGTLHLLMSGDYMPAGHLGDYTVEGRRDISLPMAA